MHAAIKRSGWALPALLAVTGALGCSGAPSSSGSTEKIEVKPVTYAQFEETLKGLKGKVVVLDFWEFK